MKIFFFYRGKPGFIEQDRTLLGQVSQLVVFDADAMGLGEYVRAFFSARQASLVYCWFAGRHALFPAFLAKFWSKPFVIASGGWDVACTPEVDYGLMRPGWKRPLARWILKSADRVLAMSDSGYRDILEHTPVKPSQVQVISLGVDILSEQVLSDGKEEMVLSVGELTFSNLKRKGIETFVKSARLLPDKHFYLVGRLTEEVKPFLRDNAAPNLRVIDYLPRTELNQFYRRAKIYVQVSYHEGFGHAVAEAMAYGCVPVITNRFALPEVVGQCGIYVPYGDVEQTAEGIRQAFRNWPSLSHCAQERVKRLFPLELRRQKLVQLLAELTNEHSGDR